VPPWDFRVPGVTSISADVHKYGYTFKGASVVLYRSRELLQHQFFWYDDWPGGLYASGTSAGTRSAAPIAGAWAAINHLGVDGYLRLAEIVAATTTASRRASMPSTASASPTSPTCRCSSSARTPSTSGPWPT
jgi:sphinganine-1-phosphate aldolase